MRKVFIWIALYVEKRVRTEHLRTDDQLCDEQRLKMPQKYEYLVTGSGPDELFYGMEKYPFDY